MRKDKIREASAGHDGTWVAHPGLVPVAMAVFDEWMPHENQIAKPPCVVTRVQASELLEIPHGVITEEGFVRNIEISLIYLESWLRGVGCVPIFNLMEDAATAEISRAQLWQWNHYDSTTDDGQVIDMPRIRFVLDEILRRKQFESGSEDYARTKFARAGELLMTFVEGPFRDFLTTELYGEIC